MKRDETAGRDGLRPGESGGGGCPDSGWQARRRSSGLARLAGMVEGASQRRSGDLEHCVTCPGEGHVQDRLRGCSCSQIEMGMLGVGWLVIADMHRGRSAETGAGMLMGMVMEPMMGQARPCQRKPEDERETQRGPGRPAKPEHRRKYNHLEGASDGVRSFTRSHRPLRKYPGRLWRDRAGVRDPSLRVALAQGEASQYHHSPATCPRVPAGSAHPCEPGY